MGEPRGKAVARKSNRTSLSQMHGSRIRHTKRSISPSILFLNTFSTDRPNGHRGAAQIRQGGVRGCRLQYQAQEGAEEMENNSDILDELLAAGLIQIDDYNHRSGFDSESISGFDSSYDDSHYSISVRKHCVFSSSPGTRTWENVSGILRSCAVAK